MKTAPFPLSYRKGFTLLELTLVLGVLLVLIGIGMYSTSALKEWRLGRDAAEKLRAAYVAQRSFLADHPTTQVNTLTHDMLRNYLPTHYLPPEDAPADYFPTAEALDGSVLHIRVDVSPPVVSLAPGGAPYDPSGSTTDSLWDVGP